ncbi:phytoene/squalene synthase family protein [Nocardia thailandica]
MSGGALPLAARSGPAAPDLASAYRLCARIAAAHGRTYFLATRLLSPDRRPGVHALYAFARVVDDLVDHPTEDPRSPTEQVDELADQLWATLDTGVVPTDHPVHAPVLAATADTVTTYAIDRAHLAVFLDSMRMDIPGAPGYRAVYPTMDALREYMRGSAAAIGLQVLPILGTVGPVRDAEPAAALLGEAFQLTNFLRDVGEDLDRGRIYLPADCLAAFGVDADHLRSCHRARTVDAPLTRALAHLIALNRDQYRRAAPGIDLLTPRVRPGIRTAAVLYAGILDEIERGGYQIFTRRATVPNRRRIAVAATTFAAARLRR